MQLTVGGPVAQFGPVAQGKQRLMATGVRSGAGNGQYFLRRQIGPLPFPWRLGKGAIVADVTAQFVRGIKTLGE